MKGGHFVKEHIYLAFSAGRLLAKVSYILINFLFQR